MRTELQDKTKLLGALFQIIKSASFYFPDYDKYFLGYKHNRSLDGWISLPKLELEEVIKSFDSENYDIEIKDGMIMLWDIQNYAVDERAYKFHIFPKVQGDGWFLSYIKDCSIEGYKRISANLILKNKLKKKEIKEIIFQATAETKKLYTPQNPKIDVPFGNKNADMVFLYIFYKSTIRYAYNLSTDNNFFVGISQYYSKKEAPRLKSGGTFNNLWKLYKKETINDYEIAWNPKYRV